MERQTSCKNFKSYFQTEYFACACVFPSDIYYQKTIAKQVYSLCPPQLNGRKTLYFVLNHVFC